MSNQPTGGGSAATIGDQLPAIESLAALAGLLGHLPAAFITVSFVYTNRINVQIQSPAEFEAWREALQVPASAVELHLYKGDSWLAMQTVAHGTEVHLTGHGLLMPPHAAVSPAADAERRQAAALLVQRHEVEDPAEPPLGGAQPPAAATVRTLADAHGGAA